MSQEKSKPSDSPSLASRIPKPPMVVGDVPAFPCIVHVKVDGGVYRGCVANLAGIHAVGNSEREMLGKIVPAFKQIVAEFHQQGESIPWISPVPEPEAAEIKRFIPVHL